MAGRQRAADAPGPSLAALAGVLRRLPPHLGWGSETLTAHLRKIRETRDERPVESAAEQGGKGAGEAGREGRLPTSDRDLLHSSFVTRHSSLVKVYPALALGMLREERAAAGRVWLLLRHLDEAGRGMVTLDEARAALTAKESPLRLCGWRRLRQLMAEGEGVFWARERPAAGRRPRTTADRPQAIERLRLFGPARVAAALGVVRLVGRPVGVPVAALLGPIGDARAHLYATFHSGRAKENTSYELRATSSERPPHASLGMPIARATLTALSGVCARSQSAYERRAGVVARANIALGERVTDGATAVVGPAEQERAWQRGRALFRLKDYRGRHGRPGAVYLAWRLPNAYGPARGQQQRPKGQQKRINRRLTDLFTQGMTGNGAPAVEKRFFGTAVGAVKAAQGGRGAGGQGRKGGGEKGGQPTEAHWPIRRARGGVGVWATVEIRE